MTAFGWWLVDALSRLLERDEREGVRGDLAEAGQSAWQSLQDVLGLVARRQGNMWRNWRPWLAAFGLALPCSLLLMGFSLSISRTFQEYLNPSILRATGWTAGQGFWLLICNILLLIGWAWTGGFVVGAISRRTLWVSVAMCFSPCIFCLARFRVESLSRFCLLLFVPPAIWGVSRGLRFARIKLSAAIFLAATVTALTIPSWGSRGPWIPNWALSWPAWYLVAIARKTGGAERREMNGE